MDNQAFTKSLQLATAKIIANTAKNLEKACFLIEGEAKRECPIDMGQLRSSMFSKVGFDAFFITGTIGNNLEYAPYVHQGTGIYSIDGNGRKTPWRYKAEKGKYKGWHFTVGQKPQPFLENAKIKNKDKVLVILVGGR